MSEKSTKRQVSEDIDTIAEHAERGKDVSTSFSNRHVAKQRVNIDFPLELLRQIDTECQRVGVTRQAWIKMVCDERLRQTLIGPEKNQCLQYRMTYDLNQTCLFAPPVQVSSSVMHFWALPTYPRFTSPDLHRHRSCGFIYHKKLVSASCRISRFVRLTITMEAAQRSYDEIIDLFAQGTTSAQILAFRPSREARERVKYLLARNKTDELTEDEAAELDRFGELEHLMQLIKARAHLYAEQAT